ncbi:MAG: TIM barrel protein [Nitrospiraceae bacterium]|nr:TIM barrel protein [Nitrospiraceae bacterium]
MKTPWTIGVQSYSFRNFDLQGAIECLRKTGLEHMEFCGVHVPEDTSAPEFGSAMELIASSGVKMQSYGVVGFWEDFDRNRSLFALAKTMEVPILTADPKPLPEVIDNIDSLIAEYGVAIAIHNHGKPSPYCLVADTLKVLEGRHPLFGACLDTGYVITEGEEPHEAIRALGPRLHSMHLKDYERTTGKETIVGEGSMDLVAVVRALKDVQFDGPIIIEYEEEPENPVPGVCKGYENLLHAIEAVQA